MISGIKTDMGVVRVSRSVAGTTLIVESEVAGMHRKQVMRGDQIDAFREMVVTACDSLNRLDKKESEPT